MTDTEELGGFGVEVYHRDGNHALCVRELARRVREGALGAQDARTDFPATMCRVSASSGALVHCSRTCGALSIMGEQCSIAADRLRSSEISAVRESLAFCPQSGSRLWVFEPSGHQGRQQPGDEISVHVLSLHKADLYCGCQPQQQGQRGDAVVRDSLDVDNESDSGGFAESARDAITMTFACTTPFPYQWGNVSALWRALDAWWPEISTRADPRAQEEGVAQARAARGHCRGGRVQWGVPVLEGEDDLLVG